MLWKVDKLKHGFKSQKDYSLFYPMHKPFLDHPLRGNAIHQLLPEVTKITQTFNRNSPININLEGITAVLLINYLNNFNIKKGLDKSWPALSFSLRRMPEGSPLVPPPSEQL
jgi:hypothetical protein